MTISSNNKCEVCGVEGRMQVSQRVPVQPKGKTRTVILNANGFDVESGDLVYSYSGNPGQPTAHVYHPECHGTTVEAYNAWAHKNLTRQIADGEEYVYPEDKPKAKGPHCFRSEPVAEHVAFAEGVLVGVGSMVSR